MSDVSICFSKVPIFVIVARIVSPGCIFSFWNVSVGAAETMEIKNSDNKINESVFILTRHLSEFFESVGHC